jgi:hypothetical protein
LRSIGLQAALCFFFQHSKAKTTGPAFDFLWQNNSHIANQFIQPLNPKVWSTITCLLKKEIPSWLAARNFIDVWFLTMPIREFEKYM